MPLTGEHDAALDQSADLCLGISQSLQDDLGVLTENGREIVPARPVLVAYEAGVDEGRWPCDPAG